MSINEELRIGNLAYSGKDIEYVRKGEDLDWLNYEPIPFTNEWMLKLNLKESEYNKGWFELHPFYIAKHNYELDTFQLGFDDSEYGIGEFKADFKYVHQLQNIYFFLSGKELSI